MKSELKYTFTNSLVGVSAPTEEVCMAQNQMCTHA